MKHTLPWRYLAFVPILLLSLTACGSDTNDHAHHEHTSPSTAAMSQPLTLHVTPDPAHPTVHRELKLKAHVKAGNQPVSDARVTFEVWKKGNPKHEKLEGQMTEKGLYTTSYAPKEKGEYHIILHVTTSQVHQMIQHSFLVGDSSR